MSGVDELFSGQAPPPPVDRAAGIRWRAALAMVLNLLGPCTCVTSVPGAALSLWVWVAADDELQRVESGALAPERRAEIVVLRDQTYRCMTMAAILCLVQVVLWVSGDYAALLSVIVSLVPTGELPAIQLGPV